MNLVRRPSSGWLSAIASSLLAMAGCGDDLPSGTAGSSTGSSDTTGVLATTTVAGDGTGADASTGGADETTGGDVVAGRGRFVLKDVESGIEPTRFHLLSFADSRTTVAQLAEGLGIKGQQVMIIDEGRALAYCAWASPAPGRRCEVVDLATDSPSAPQSLLVDPVPADVQIELLDWVGATRSLTFATYRYTGPRGVFRSVLMDGIVETPEVIASANGVDDAIYGFSVEPDGSRVGYVRASTDAPPEAWVAPADPPDPGAAVKVSNVVDPSASVGAPTFIPGRDSVLYTEESAAYPGGSIWLVDPSSPQRAVRVDEPVAPPLQILTLKVAPDGHALVYYVKATGSPVGDLMFVSFVAGVPQAPVLLSSLSDDAAYGFSVRWSPDSAWVAYSGVHDSPTTEQLYLVEASSEVPGAPVRVSDGAGLLFWIFDETGQWLYVTADGGAGSTTFSRAGLSGPARGSIQAIGPRTPWTGPYFALSHDGGSLTGLSTTNRPDDVDLLLVDVSGEVPGPPTLLVPSAGPDSGPSVGVFSWDDSLLAYFTDAPGESQSLLWLHDLATGVDTVAYTGSRLRAWPVANLP